MTRYLAPLAVVFALATTAHAQNYVSQSYTTTDDYGNSATTTTTVQNGGSVVGLIANQPFNNSGFNVYYGGTIPVYNGNCPPSYYGGYNGGYAGYPNYGGSTVYYGNNGYYNGNNGYYNGNNGYYNGNNGYYNNGGNGGYHGNHPAPRPVPAQNSYPAANFPYGYVPRTYIPGQPAQPGVIYNGMAITPTPQLNGTPPVAPTPYNYGWQTHRR